ncbi:LPXTG cell wall anchor domain-containing protein [Isobaculum melis]|uniref:LPXTG cell wall anchor domain-containing protein n=1 Tax=Isobaculum melis TaxID=142588 RepID=UPI0015A699D6|nr:LPXTG cell wall anchor domain-containing protein [Isobaculum melis]
MKKNKMSFIFISIGLIFLLFVPLRLIEASEDIEYRSRIEIGFYGKYEPETESKPDYSIDYSEVIPLTRSQEILPSTGEKNSGYLMVIGLTIVGSILLINIKQKVSRRNEENEKNS